jgi:DNA-3-methyladenine glycosylase
LTIALGIGGQHHGLDLCQNPQKAFHAARPNALQYVTDLRIGITKSAHLPWRFLAADNAFVSAKPGPHAFKGGP